MVYLANAIKNYADSKVATITGGGASYILPTASETLKGGVMIGTGLSMAGDTLNVTIDSSETYSDFTGATSVIGGASGLVPAPAAGDNEKFLRGDGIWTVPVGGGSYPIATSSQAGLMSAEDKLHLDAVTDTVVTVVGGDFVPPVDSFYDLLTYKDANATFLDNKLKIVLEGYHARDYAQTSDRIPFQFDATDIFVNQDASAIYLCSGVNSVSLETVVSSVDAAYDVYKLSETAGFVIRSATLTKNGHNYSGSWQLRGFNVAESGDISLSTNYTLASIASTVASAKAWTNVDFIESITDPSNFIFMPDARANDNHTYSYNTFYVRPSDGGTSSLQSAVTIGTDYATPKGKTNIDNITNELDSPSVSFADGKITITSGASRQYPIWHYEKRVRDSSDSITGGGDYVVIHHGIARVAPTNMQLTTISGGVTSTLQPWLEDDDNVIAGVWNAKSDNQIYAVTFKKGTYDFSVDWFDKYSTVWTFDFLTPRIIKTSKKLSGIIDDLQL